MNSVSTKLKHYPIPIVFFTVFVTAMRFLDILVLDDRFLVFLYMLKGNLDILVLDDVIQHVLVIKFGEHNYFVECVQGTDRIRGLTLSPIESNFSTVTYAAAQFASMHELHLLILDGCIVEGDDFSSWSEELRWLQWRWSPCTELPFHLKLPKLTVLDLTDSINLSCLWKEDALVEVHVYFTSLGQKNSLLCKLIIY